MVGTKYIIPNMRTASNPLLIVQTEVITAPATINSFAYNDEFQKVCTSPKIESEFCIFFTFWATVYPTNHTLKLSALICIKPCRFAKAY